MAIVIDTGSPERGWKPFIDWCTANGIAADELCSIEVDDPTAERTNAMATFRAYDHEGNIAIDGGEVLTFTRQGLARGPVPLHPSRTEAA